ncbi:hypothetical protein [Persicobacter diffluens]|uniref:CPBP family intramembrane metalloprotease n=1 Tax=Persicobacter diffluens TaxID=981 RepID=A0AAN4VUY5_9BACT|nr:hypothetical protein PEDI_03310 [Persicobacter diffluens]
MSTIFSEGESLKHFWKAPRDIYQKEDFQTALPKVLGIYLMMWIPMFLVMGVLYALESKGIVDNLDNHAIEQFLETMPFAVVFVLAGIVQPTLEELGFRLFLRPKYAGISFFIWIVFLAAICFQSLPKNLAIVLIGALSVFLYFYFSDWRHRPEMIWGKYFKGLFWLSVFSFGLAHAVNFVAVDVPLWAIPLMVLPQIVAGYFLGFTRLRFGISWAIFFHCLHNSLLLIGYLINEHYLHLT